MYSLQRITSYLVGAAVILVLLYYVHLTPSGPSRIPEQPQNPVVDNAPAFDGSASEKFDWAARVPHYPVKSYEPIPKPYATKLPKVQYDFGPESAETKATREAHRAAVKTSLQRCWASYREYAWLQDELTPITGQGRNTFGGWAATLVDTLDLLWIADMKDEFSEAVDAALTIDFTSTEADEINVFETTIRYLGGFLAAYDLSGDDRLLKKSLDLAEMLYAAFDTPNRMPITRWDFHRAAAGEAQVADDGVLVAEIGSLSMEFTRLAQISQNPKWYDATARVTEMFAKHQSKSNLPGLWPLTVNARKNNFFSGTLFTLGAMADSVYEYLPKMFALLGGSKEFAKLYQGAADAAIAHATFRPMLPDQADVLIAGPLTAEKYGGIYLEPQGQHLVCFAGGMFALGGRLLGNKTHIDVGRKLTDGCIWTYEHSPLGIMPETFTAVPCDLEAGPDCPWEQQKWRDAVRTRHPNNDQNLSTDEIIASLRLEPGFTSVPDTRYILRPEAIESVFILYRITGDATLLESAWSMFEAIQTVTETDLANAAIEDVLDPSAPKSDSMESFWTAETLKYFYLIFSNPDEISLDEWVFNTEAHPFKRAV